jgi:hypothetical protein
MCSIHYGNKDASSSVGDVDRYVIRTKLLELDAVLNMSVAFIR